MISVEDAQARIRNTAPGMPVETVPIGEASGRILHEPVSARMTQPPFAASAMDGYAVRFSANLAAGAQLCVTGISSAGARFDGGVGEGEAVRIFTGAPMPEGADHVVIQEDVDRNGDIITLRLPQGAPRHVRKAGIDFSEGDTLLGAGERLTAARLALLAAANIACVAVRRKPRIAIIANGDELAMPGAERGRDDVICSTPFALTPMINAWGGDATFLGIARDDPASIRSIAEKANGFDLIAPIGGASVGDRDLMRSVFADLGFETDFEKVSVRPGKPAWYAIKGETRVIGLPGNPASAMVTAILFLREAVAAMLGTPSPNLFRAVLDGAVGSNGARETYLRATARSNADGALLVAALPEQDSSLISVMARANALIRRSAEAPAAEAGAVVDIVLIGDL